MCCIEGCVCCIEGCVLYRGLCVLYRGLCVLHRGLCVLYRGLCVLYRGNFLFKLRRSLKQAFFHSVCDKVYSRYEKQRNLYHRFKGLKVPTITIAIITEIASKQLQSAALLLV